jgi:hypothetical protein
VALRLVRLADDTLLVYLLRVTWNYVLALVNRRLTRRTTAGTVIRVMDLDNELASIFMLRFQSDF